MNNKGKKTNLVAYGQAVIGVAVFVMWVLGKITSAEIAMVLGGLAYLGNMITSKLAKDQDATHSDNPFGSRADHIGHRPGDRGD